MAHVSSGCRGSVLDEAMRGRLRHVRTGAGLIAHGGENGRLEGLRTGRLPAVLQRAWGMWG